VSRARIAITLGDPRGIGPEIVEKALADPAVAAVGDFVVFGASGCLAGSYDMVPVGKWSAGDTAERAGWVAGEAIAAATRAALEGSVDAIVTAPIEKNALHAGGWKFPGHTEMLQQLSGSAAVGMLMAAERTALGGPLRVLIATTHIPLREVPRAVTADLLVTQSELVSRSLHRWWGIERPRLAMCAFNPHASDGGLFGDEEERIYRPAVERLRAAGVLSSDPLPADTVFSRAIRGEFDAVIAPYHDVGMAAFKTACFGSGVNVTLGLPFPRTSPDHGTAFDIAGRGIANPASMVEAVLLAARFARAR
jgi:4-hydroxythreonine-4-phosphate dehydrogenase